MVTLATATVPDFAVASGSLAGPGPFVVSASSSSVIVGVSAYWTVSQSALTSTVAGRCLSRNSLENVRTVLSSRVECRNDGVTYCTPKRIQMCRSGLARKIGVSRCNLDNVSCLSYSRVRSADKAPRHRYCCTYNPITSRMLGGAAC